MIELKFIFNISLKNVSKKHNSVVNDQYVAKVQRDIVIFNKNLTF